jgi:SET and MYND domain-containing protein
LAPLGVCVSPLVALINHSCEPNAVVVFPRSAKDPANQEPEAQVIAIRDILPDEEVAHLNFLYIYMLVAHFETDIHVVH